MLCFGYANASTEDPRHTLVLGQLSLYRMTVVLVHGASSVALDWSNKLQVFSSE